MKCYIDLHIHSVLSPCADLIMTSKPIISKLKKNNIYIFAITDHNSGKNLDIFELMAKKENMILIYGMEVQTIEETHILVYFKNIADFREVEKIVYNRLPNIKNREDIYGYQLILNENDDYCEKEEKLLSGSTEISIDELYKIVRERDGIIIPAHIDRSNSIISNLGYIPEIDFDGFEIYNRQKIEKIKEKYHINKPIFSSFDAHFLDGIESPKMEIDIDEFNIESIFKSIKNGKIKVI